MGKGNEKAEEIMKERFGRDSVISLATAVSGTPYVRPVNAYYEGGSFYVITYALSRKMDQIKENDIVAISGEWFSGHGRAINLGYFGKDNNAAIAGKLKKAFDEWIDNGHMNLNDENTIILEIKIIDAVLMSHGVRYEL
jgi:general stress protein 26